MCLSGSRLESVAFGASCVKRLAGSDHASEKTLSESLKTQDHAPTVKKSLRVSQSQEFPKGLGHKLASALIRREVSNDELVVLQ